MSESFVQIDIDIQGAPYLGMRAIDTLARQKLMIITKRRVYDIFKESIQDRSYNEARGMWTVTFTGNL